LRTTDNYLALITPWNAIRPKFVATVAASVDPLVRIQGLLSELAQEFDLDEAVGVQLDAVGVRVGRSRKLTTPLRPFFFSWDDATRGWDSGVWSGPYDTRYGISLLDDDTFRRLIRARILANVWDGTIPGQQAILDAFFVPGTLAFVEDVGVGVSPPITFTWDDPVRGWDTGSWAIAGEANPYPDLLFSWDDPARGWDKAFWTAGDTTPPPAPIGRVILVGVSGKWPSITDLELLGQGLVAAKPLGTTIEYAVTSVEGSPLFGFDVDNEYIAGWDEGAWGLTPDALVDMLTA
jgi:hypothetical protein